MYLKVNLFRRNHSNLRARKEMRKLDRLYHTYKPQYPSKHLHYRQLDIGYYTVVVASSPYYTIGSLFTVDIFLV